MDFLPEIILTGVLLVLVCYIVIVFIPILILNIYLLHCCGILLIFFCGNKKKQKKIYPRF